MTLADIQRHLGVTADGVLGPVTLTAIAKAIGMTAWNTRRISPKGIALIKEFEGCKLTAYRDAVGVWTIGYGSTGAHVKPGMTITQAEAEKLLLDDLDRFESAVAKYAKVATQDQFDALVSFAFNVGPEALRTSTLLRLHNEGQYALAAEQFARWNKAGGKVMAGLTRRRAAEAALYRGAR